MYAKLAALAVAALIGSTAAQAAPIDSSPITSDYYLAKDNLLWAWASPVSDLDWGNNILYAPGIQDGWRYATTEEWATRPTNQQLSTKLCAARFWNSGFVHCDFGDVVSNVITGTSADLWYVKTANADVPEPAMLGLLGMGVLGIAGARRRKA